MEEKVDTILLSNFCVLKAFTDSGKSILDCLLPFVEYGLAKLEKEYLDTSEIKEVVLADCGIDIPFNTIKTLLKRLKKLNHITCYENYSKVQIVRNINSETSDYKTRLQNCKRDISALTENCKEKCGFNISNDDMSKMLFSFIEVYQSCIDLGEGGIEAPELVDEEAEKSILRKDASEEFVKISDYIIEISSNNTVLYETFKGMFYGYLLRQFISKNDVANIPRFNTLTVYVDSNFLLRVLDMQAPWYYEASTELLNIMLKNGITVSVIPSIVDEVRTVLGRNYYKFINEKDSLLSLHGDKVAQINGVIGAFFRRKMNITDIGEFIDNLEDEIKKIGVKIAQTDVDLVSKYWEKEQQKIAEFKIKNSGVENYGTAEEQEQAKEAIIQKSLLDAKVLNMVRSKRRLKTCHLSSCKYLFLTCDNVVINVNSHFHKQDKTIPEAISESRLTNALFMSNPTNDTNASILLLVSIFKSSTYLKYEVLNRFHSDLQRYIEQNPGKAQYLTNIMNNQNLFNEIGERYAEDEWTEGVEYVAELFKRAEDDKKQFVQGKEREKSEMQETIEGLKKDIISLTEANQENEKIGAELEEEKRKRLKNLKKTEKFFRNVWLGGCVTIFFVLTLITAFILTVWGIPFNLDNLSKYIVIVTPVLYVLVFSVYSLRDKYMDKMVKVLIHDSSEFSLWYIIFEIALNSLWALVPAVLGLLINILEK